MPFPQKWFLRRLLRLLASLSLCLLVSCANLATRRVELTSIPSGAEVKTLQGETLGVTPLELTGPALSRVTQDDRMTVSLWAPGYVERECTLDVHGEDIHQIELTKLDDNFFQKRFTLDFARPANRMARELLVAREMIQLKKLDEAEKILLSFQQSFPNIAASYVMLANIALLRGEGAQAREYLIKAQNIDPSDSEVARLLLRESGGEGAQ